MWPYAPLSAYDKETLLAGKLDPKSTPARPVRAAQCVDHLQYRIDNPPSDLTVEVVEITPDGALLLEKINTHNRNRSRKHQGDLAGFMLRGVWYDATTVIAVTTEGYLANGQHTIGAIYESGSTRPMIVAWGVDESAQAVFDTQSKRTIAQAMALEDEDNTAALAAVSKIIYQVENNTGNPASWVSEPTAVEYVQKIDDDIREAAGVALEIKKAFGKVSIPVSVIGAAYYFCAKVDRPLAETFFEDLRVGGPTSNRAAQQLRSYFLNRGAARGSQSRREQVIMWDTVIRGFNKARKNDATGLFSKKSVAPNRWTLPR
ncbi:MAG: hypothetical protein NVS3B1_17830 [Marmoricola sp.]